MVNKELLVFMGPVLAGKVWKSDLNRLGFAYAESYIRTGKTPISVSMPIAAREYKDGARNRDALVSNFLWGLLPDNPQVIELWAKRYQVSPSSPFNLLSTPVGADCAGAISFHASIEEARTHFSSSSVDWWAERQVAEHLKQLKTDSRTWLGANFTGQFSLAGAQSKTALLYHQGKWGLPRGFQATTHILKPAASGFLDHDLNEYLCLAAARRAGLSVSKASLVSFDDQQALVVERYDRHVDDKGQVARIHQEDMCQALGASPSLKYEYQGGPSANDIINIFKRTMPANRSSQAVYNFVDALVWNWIIGGTDAHAKNYGLLLAGSLVRATPLYDLASVLPYSDLPGFHIKKIKMAMKIGKDYDMYLHANYWPLAARNWGLDSNRIVDRVRELAKKAPQVFLDASKDSSISSLKSTMPKRLLNAVSERAKECYNLVK